MKILFFQPFVGIWEHSLLEFQLAKILTNKTNSVTILNCEGVFKGICATRQHFGLGSENNLLELKQICLQCKSNSKVGKKYLTGINFESITTHFIEEDTTLDETMEIIPVEESLNREDFRAGLYELVLRHKKRVVSLSDIEKQELIESAWNYRITKKFAERYLSENKFDCVVIYNPQYSINSAFSSVAKKMGIKVIYISAPGNLDQMKTSLRIYDWFKFLLKDPALTYWERDSLHVKQSEFSQIARHKKVNFQAKSAFTYSEKAKGLSTREFFGIKEKHILLMAMSSYDEYLAAQYANLFPTEILDSKVFNNQNEWLKFTIDWAKDNKDLALVIRPHPREFPNKRESRKAPVNAELFEIITNRPKNVYIDSPEYKFPLHDHFKEINGVIISWSNVALEALLEGIPVVGYDENICLFPNNIFFSGQSKKEYLKNLELLLRARRSSEHIENASKWFTFSTIRGSVFLGGPLEERFPFKHLPFRSGVFYRVRKTFPNLFKSIDTLLPVRNRDTERILQILKGDKDSLF